MKKQLTRSTWRLAALALAAAACSLTKQPEAARPFGRADAGGNLPVVISAGSGGAAGAVDAAAGAAGTDARDADLTDAGSAPPDAGADVAPEAPPPAPPWLGRPPAVPLIVRTPYLSVWSPADAPTATWPTFWNGAIKAIAGLARVDGTSYVFLGTPGGVGAPMKLESRALTPTKTTYVMSAGGVAVTLDFLSSVEPDDLKRQSAPLGYVTARAHATDGASHQVSLYFDITGEWAHGDPKQLVTWARGSVPHAGGNLLALSITPAAPQLLGEANESPTWGTAFIATADASNVTTQIGADTIVRPQAATQGKLDGTIDGAMPRAINDAWPVLGVSFDLGQVSATTSSPATLVLGHARDPAVSYLGKSVPPLWRSYWATWQAMAADAYDDAAGAAARMAALDARVVADATKAGGEHYAALCTLALRQAFGGTELVGSADKPWLMLKEISSDGNVSTVDVVYPASPVLLYTNPRLLQLMLEPLLDYAENGGWPKAFAEHDLGSAYPNATGHDDGNEEDMPIEESADMLLMMAAYAQRAAPADAKAFATRHYTIAKQWADYLVPRTLDPENQNQTDDFTGFINHSVNLALKGILGVGAMGQLAALAGNAADAQSYGAQAKTLIGQWAAMAQDASGTHLLLEYDKPGTWSLKYNALFDRVLGLGLVPGDVLAEESAWYATRAQAFGVQLDPRNPYTKSDWEIWTAAALDDPAVRQIFIDGVYAYATTSTARVPFGDLYFTGTGQWDAFQARPVQGGVFALLLRGAR